MKKIPYFLFLTLSLNLFSQNDYCDTIYSYKDVQIDAMYRGNDLELMRYFNIEISPLLEEIYQDEQQSYFKMVFLIDKNGNVLDLLEMSGNYPKEIFEKVRKKVKQMKGWKPGTVDGKSVCSEGILYQVYLHNE